MKLICFQDKEWTDWERRCDDNDVELQKRIIIKKWWEIEEVKDI